MRIFYTDYCGEVLNDMNGTIASPNYPRKYAFRLNCVWTLNAPSNYSIKLIFDDFETESRHDTVEVFDGKTVNDTLLDTFSGKYETTYLPDITSNSESMTIRFHTDSSSNHRGFSAHYMVVDEPKSIIFFFIKNNVELNLLGRG